jgi:hypothetical protein
MIKFLEGRTYYGLAGNTDYSDVHEVGPYNAIILQRIDEWPVGPTVAVVELQTADDPTLETWITVGDIPPGEVSLRSNFGRHLRVAVDIQTSASTWEEFTEYVLDQYVSANGVIWICIQDYQSCLDNEPAGTSSGAADWQDAFYYAGGILVTTNSNGICYCCIQDHTSSSSDEPGVGANWQDYWVLNYRQYWTEYVADLLYTKISVYGKLVRD